MPLITFEGSEGCRKSTQVKRLAARLEKEGIIADTIEDQIWQTVTARFPALPRPQQSTLNPQLS